MGYHVGRGGWLEQDSDNNGKKNGNGKTNGSTNGNGSSNGHSNGGNGGNGGANGGGGIGESKTFTQFLEDVKIEHIENLGFEKIIHTKLSDTSIVIKSSENVKKESLKISFSKSKVLFFDKSKNRMR